MTTSENYVVIYNNNGQKIGYSGDKDFPFNYSIPAKIMDKERAESIILWVNLAIPAFAAQVEIISAEQATDLINKPE